MITQIIHHFIFNSTPFAGMYFPLAALEIMEAFLEAHPHTYKRTHTRPHALTHACTHTRTHAHTHIHRKEEQYSAEAESAISALFVKSALHYVLRSQM